MQNSAGFRVHKIYIRFPRNGWHFVYPHFNIDRPGSADCSRFVDLHIIENDIIYSIIIINICPISLATACRNRPLKEHNNDYFSPTAVCIIAFLFSDDHIIIDINPCMQCCLLFLPHRTINSEHF